MQDIEPYYSWKKYYDASDDAGSPFYGRTYSEFEYTHSIYNFYIHPQWDEFGSSTLYIKILFCDYNEGFAIIEMMGEWNDCINNDIMFLKRDVIEPMLENGIVKFILVGENVLNFHASDDCYYEEWFQEVEDGWIAGVNFRKHVVDEFCKNNIDYYLVFGGQLDFFSWRTLSPMQMFDQIAGIIERRIGS